MVAQACEVARWLRAPPELDRLLHNFYSGARRLFCVGTHVGSNWVVPTRGVMQGCPLSPFVAIMIMQCWAWHVGGGTGSQHHVDAAVYLDDRTIWDAGVSESFHRVQALQNARLRSDQFDQDFGLTCRATKCLVSAAPCNDAGAEIAQRFGYDLSHEVEVLGVAVPVESPREARLNRLSMDEVRMLIRVIRTVARTIRTRRQLVLSKLLWMAGVLDFGEDFLLQLRRDFLSAFAGKAALQDTPHVILLEMLHWPCDPVVALKSAALRAAVRFHCHEPTWMDQPPLLTAVKRWPQLLPGSLYVVAGLGWRASADGAVISRFDQQGVERRFELGVDNFSLIFDWLVKVHRQRALANCGRVVKSLHRQEGPELAQGWFCLVYLGAV